MSELSYESARALAETIERFWLARGFSIQTVIVSELDRVTGRGGEVFCVRSNLLRGLPRAV